MSAACLPRAPERPPLAVASSNSPRQLLLGYVAILALEDDGYRIVDRTGMVDSVAVRRALAAGSVDISWEYTGTAWSSLLGHDQPVPSDEQLYMSLRAEDLPRGITWLPPTSCRERTGVVMVGDVADETSLQTISDLVAYMTRRAAKPLLCVSADLVDAMNGLRGLSLVYQWPLGASRIRAAPEEEALRLLRVGECQAALVNDGDGAAAAADLVMLSDDRALFGASGLAIAVRTDALHRYPSLEARLVAIGAALTSADLYRMEEAARRGAKPKTLARRFLRDTHLIGRYRATPAPTATVRPTVTPAPTFTPVATMGPLPTSPRRTPTRLP